MNPPPGGRLAHSGRGSQRGPGARSRRDPGQPGIAAEAERTVLTDARTEIGFEACGQMHCSGSHHVHIE